MRECPNCKELNGDNNSRCWKCNTFLGTVSSYKKKCPDCGSIFNGNKDTCDYCGSTLISYDENYQYSSANKQNSSTWMYVCTFIIPLIGIILGCIKISNDKRDDSGKSLIILGVILIILYPILSIALYSCSN